MKNYWSILLQIFLLLILLQVFPLYTKNYDSIVLGYTVLFYSFFFFSLCISVWEVSINLCLMSLLILFSAIPVPDEPMKRHSSLLFRHILFQTFFLVLSYSFHLLLIWPLCSFILSAFPIRSLNILMIVTFIFVW